jgi:adenine-specific DNA-methyltransferase
VKDGNADHITREPEMVKAFRDTWKDGIHSYLSYIRDRLTVARDLLTESGSIFVQIGDENVHRVRAVMDEVFGPDNFFAQISFVKAGALGATGLPRQLDYIIWFAKNIDSIKYRKALLPKSVDELGQYTQIVESDYSLRPLSSNEKANPKSMALRCLVWNTTISFSQRRCERMGGQVLEFGHAQVGNGDEVGRGSVAPCGPFGLLQ